VIDRFGWKKRKADQEELQDLLRLEREAAERRLVVSRSVQVPPVKRPESESTR